MKGKKSLLRAVVASVVMVTMSLMCMMPVHAEEAHGDYTQTQTITINPNGQEGIGGADRFEAYRIFVGHVGTDDHEQLVDITWGDGVDSDALVEAMKSDDMIGGAFREAYDDWWATSHDSQINEAELVAEFLTVNSRAPGYADRFARLVAEHLKTRTGVSVYENNQWSITVPLGYYLVKDTYIAEAETDKRGTVSSYILEVIGPEEVTLKASLPTVTKKVEGQDGWLTETASTVNYTLTGTVSENIDEYETYEYEFIDVISGGITYSGDDNLYVDVDGSKIDSSKYSVSLTEGDEGVEHTLMVHFDNLKDCGVTVNADSKIVVHYQGVLNKFAVAGKTGNENEVTLKYSNNPYATGKGTSVPDEVRTYTISLHIKKVNGDDEPLEGVGFILKNGIGKFAKLEEQDGVNAVVSWEDDKESATKMFTRADGYFDIKGLSTGTYTLIETDLPLNYEPMKDIVFDITGGTIADNGDLGDIAVALDAADAHRDDVELTSGYEDGTIDMVLVNYKAPLLPHTGGIGATVVYTISIIALMGGAVLVAASTRKKKNDNKKE